MTDETLNGVTDRQAEIFETIRELNTKTTRRATADELARIVSGDITTHTVKSHIRQLRQAGYGVEYDRSRMEYVADHPDEYDAGTRDEHEPETVDDLLDDDDPMREEIAREDEPDRWAADGEGQHPGDVGGTEAADAGLPDSCDYPECLCEPAECRELDDGEDAADELTIDSVTVDGQELDVGNVTVEGGSDDLNDREAYILDRLPASADELADDLDVSLTAVNAHLLSARSKGYAVKHDDENDAYYLPNGESKREIGSEDMGQTTRDANNWLDAAEDRQRRQLRGIDPVEADQQPEEHHEDVVAALSDVHVGQDVETHGGQTIYSEDEWREAYRLFGEKCLSIPDRMLAPHIEFDTFHLVLNGDHVTNENIYPHQIEDVGAYLADQIDIAVDELLPVIFGLADRYPVVNIVCQVGNHGELRADGQTRDANADLLVYRELKRHLSRSECENINFQIGSATPFTTFSTRGGEWRSLVSHGEAAYEQITGTSASDSQMENWLNASEPKIDTFYLAHYHEFRRAPVDGIPAIRTPSPKPGGPHEFEIGALQAAHAQPKLGYIHGVSDTRPITWSAVMDYESGSDPEHANERARRAL